MANTLESLRKFKQNTTSNIPATSSSGKLDALRKFKSKTTTVQPDLKTLNARKKQEALMLEESNYQAPLEYTPPVKKPSLTAKVRKAYFGEILKPVRAGLDLLSRPLNAAVGALQESKILYPKQQYVNVDNKLYPAMSQQQPNTSDVLKRVRDALKSGLEGTNRPEPLTAVMPQEQIKKARDKGMGFAVGVGNLAAGTAFDPLNLPIGGAAKLTGKLATAAEKSLATTAAKNIKSLDKTLTTGMKAVSTKNVNKFKTVEQELQDAITTPKPQAEFEQLSKELKGKVPEQFKGVSPGEPGYKPVRVGAQIQIVDTPVTGKTPPFKYADAELERIDLQNKGLKTLTPVEKVRKIGTDIKNMFTRPIGTLADTGANRELYKELILLPKLRNMAADDTIRTLNDIVKGMDKNSFDMFRRKVFLDNLAQEAKLGNKLPNKWTPDMVNSELQRLDAVMPQTVRDAVVKRQPYWNGIKDEYIPAMKGVGIDLSDALTKENYFHHQVLAYMDIKNNIIGSGKKLKTPANRGFTKARTGEYEGNINTDYLQAEYEVMAQMKHDTGVAKIMKNIKDNYSITAKLKSDAKTQGIKDWHELIPEGSTTFQPREGNAFYMSQPLGSEVVDQALALRGITLKNIKDPKIRVALEDIMNDLADQVPVLAMGGKREEWVVTNEIAETLNNLTKVKTTNALSRISKSVQNTWKRWILTLNPKSVIKYNIRNFSGDMDAVIAGNPGTIKKIPTASKELFDAIHNGKFTPGLKSWYDRGGYQSLLQAQEISEVSKLKPFEKFRDTSILEKAAKPLKSYAEFTKNATNYREAVGRYAAYIDYIEQLKSGKLKNYGSSRPELIDGLKTIEDKAFKLSNDLLGAYDEVSEAGQIIRNHLIPFYSWMEINMKRYKNLFKNAFENKEVARAAGLSAGLVAKLGVKTASKVGGIFAMTVALSAWNQLKYPELEENLSDDVKARPHIILGKDEKGNTKYFSRMGALNDFLEWFGLESATQDVKDMINGKLTVRDFLVNAVKSPVNKVAGAITPLYKTTAEIATGQKLYPDVTKPMPIRDRKQHVASSLGLRSEYDVAAGKPHRPYFENLNDALLYKTDPEEQAYYSILDLKAKFKEKATGEKRTGGLYINKKSDALYNWKLSLKYGDDEARKKYIKEYFKLGGTTDGIKDSLGSLNPLFGIKKELQPAFVNSLDPKEKEKLRQAMKYYSELIKTTK